MKVVVSLNGACVRYSSLRTKAASHYTLNDLTFDLYEGETLGVIGRNGAGKSTFLKLMSGILAPDKGSVKCHVDNIMMLSLQAGFLPYLNGEENAMLNGMFLGVSKTVLKSQMNDICDYSGLGEKFYDPISTYSTGMAARLGFAIAMQAIPDVMMIDEVMGVGDIEFCQKSTELLQLRIKSDKTVVLTSHNTETIRTLCDRVLWLDNGEVMGLGEVNDILSKYESA